MNAHDYHPDELDALIASACAAPLLGEWVMGDGALVTRAGSWVLPS